MDPLRYHKINGVKFTEALARLNESLDSKAFCDFVRYIADIDDKDDRAALARGLFRAFDRRKDGKWIDRMDDVVSILDASVDAGFAPAWRGTDDKTLLHYAAAVGSPLKADAACQYLMEKGVDVFAKDRDGCAPISYVSESGWCGFAPLNVVLAKPLTIETHRLCKGLILAGESPNSLDMRSGNRPLHQLLLTKHGAGHPELLRDNIVELLLESKANPNLFDAYGRTPLHMAAATPDSERLQKLMIAHGADPDLKDFDGRTAKDIAALCPEQKRAILDVPDDVAAEVLMEILDEGAFDIDIEDAGETTGMAPALTEAAGALIPTPPCNAEGVWPSAPDDCIPAKLRAEMATPPPAPPVRHAETLLSIGPLQPPLVPEQQPLAKEKASPSAGTPETGQLGLFGEA